MPSSLTLVVALSYFFLTSCSGEKGAERDRGGNELAPEEEEAAEVVSQSDDDDEADEVGDSEREDVGRRPSTKSPTNGSAERQGVTFTDCEEQGRAWVASVNDGPAVCGGKLVSWCCSESEVLRRLPGARQLLEEAFAKRNDEGKKLYHCSNEGGGKIRLHFARIEKKAKYGWHAYSGYERQVDGGDAGECVPVTYEDLIAEGFEPTPSPSPSASPAPTAAPAWNGEIAPIVKASCASSSCHGVASTASVIYEDSEANVRRDAAKIKERIGRAATATGVMPPSGSGFDLPVADKAKVIQFLDAGPN